MRTICDGHEYRYNDKTGELKNNYGTVVATLERADYRDEYHYAVKGDVVLNSIHENALVDSPVARMHFVVSAYVASEY